MKQFTLEEKNEVLENPFIQSGYTGIVESNFEINCS